MSSYQVLARKYRPQQFAEVVGQENVVRTLENALKLNRIAHAYLFVGPRGTGKTTLARIFAKGLNCGKTKEPTTKPCGECSQCLEIIAGNSMDVMEIDGASNNGVEQVRELRELVRYAPSHARFKIIYIDEVHMLSNAAFNALLKTLEEPPAHVKFLFATTDPQKIPLTILSRCQRFDLHRISSELIIRHLGKMAKLEKVSISDDALRAIARGSTGCMRDAQSAMDQLIAFCGNKIEESDVLSVFGLASGDQITTLLHGILEADRAGVVRLVAKLMDEGRDLHRLLSELVEQFRNVLVMQAGVELNDLTANEVAGLKKAAESIKRGRTLRILEILSAGENQMKWALSKNIHLEITLLKAIETADEVLIEEVLGRLKGISAGSIPLPPAAAPSNTTRSLPPPEEKKPVEIPRKAAAPPKEPLPEVKDLWKELLDHVSKHFPLLKTSLKDGNPLQLTEDTLVIGLDDEFALSKEMLQTPKSLEQLHAALREIAHRPIKVKVVSALDPSIPQGDEPLDASSKGSPSIGDEMKKFEEDPLIHKALEIFKGQIVDIRK